jgi:hypothetical protein
MHQFPGFIIRFIAFAGLEQVHSDTSDIHLFANLLLKYYVSWVKAFFDV